MANVDWGARHQDPRQKIALTTFGLKVSAELDWYIQQPPPNASILALRLLFERRLDYDFIIVFVKVPLPHWEYSFNLPPGV
jgi:hypothetical protein